MIERSRARKIERRVEERGIREPKTEWTATMQRITERTKRIVIVRLLMRCSGGASGSSSSVAFDGFVGGEEGERMLYAPFEGLEIRKRDENPASRICWRVWDT